jgi:integrase
LAVDKKEFDLIKEGIYHHKTNKKRFLFRVYLPDSKLEKKKVFTVQGSKTPKQILDDADIAFYAFKNEVLNTVATTKPNDGITLDELYKRYRETVDCSKAWQQKKLRDYDLYIKITLGHKKLKDISNEAIERIKAQMSERGLAPRTRKTINEILSPLFVFAEKNKYIARGQSPEIDPVKIPSQKKTVTAAGDKMRTLYDAINTVYADNSMYRAMFLIWLLLAKRKTETLYLKWEYIDFENDYIWLTSDTTKTDENQRFYLPPEIKQALLEFREPTGYVFKNYETGLPLENVYRQVKKIKEASAIQEFTPHYCRNLLVSASHDEGVAASNLSGALGHGDANTISKYLTINYYKGSKEVYGSIRGILEK